MIVQNITNVKTAIKENVMSKYSQHSTAIKEDEKLKSKSLEVRTTISTVKYKSELIKGVTEWSEDDTATKGQVGDGVNTNQNEQGQKNQGRIWEKMELGETRWKTPTGGGKGGSPWKLNVGVERKSTADLESSTRAQVNTRTRLQRKPPHKVEKGETPLKLKVGAEKKKWKK